MLSLKDSYVASVTFLRSDLKNWNEREDVSSAFCRSGAERKGEA